LALQDLIFDQTLWIRDTLGDRHVVRPREVLAFFNNPLVLSYLAMIVALLCAADPSGMREHVNIFYTLLIWPAVSATYLLTAVFLSLCLAALQLRTPSFTIPSLIFHGLALAPSLMLGKSLTYFATSGASGFGILPETIYYLIIIEIVTIMFFRFVRPLLALSEQSAVVVSEQPQEKTLTIGSERFALAAVRSLEAQEHHVQVSLSTGRETHRARLSDVVAQTNTADGIQPHRSWWVAYHAIQRIEKKGARSILVLEDGTEIPLARSRVEEVNAWFATQQNADHGSIG